MTNISEVIEAFADGEPVDPAELDRALADTDGRGQLIDLLVLRGFVNGPGLVPFASPASSPRVIRPWRWLTVAALVTIVASIGGYVAGTRTAAMKQPGELAATGAPGPATAAPTPTRVIRFEPGVDWTEHRGGH
jgi:hypothetical protein